MDQPMSQSMKRRRDDDEDNELTMSSVHSSISDVSVDSSATEMTENSSRRRDDDDDEMTKSSVDSLATEISGDSSATETAAGKKVICNPFSDVRNFYIFS
jgi:hypothetical protein